MENKYNNEIVEMLNKLDKLNIEDGLKFLFQNYFYYENKNSFMYNFLFNNIMKYMKIDENKVSKYNLNMMDKQIIIKSIYEYNYEKNVSLNKPLLNLLYFLNNDETDIKIAQSIVNEYLEQLRLLLKYQEKCLELKK